MTSYVVTGTSRGIGLEWVHFLSSDPKKKVFALVRSKANATRLLDFVASDENKHKNIVVLEADLNDVKSIKAAAEEVASATGGTLDVLINNGALLHHERNMLTLDTYPDDEILESDMLAFFKTNVIGITHTINSFIPLLRAGKTKKVSVVTSSMGSTRFAMDTNYSAAAVYSISKAALNMVVAKFATRLRDEGFTFLAVSPGLVKTMPGPSDEIDKIYENIISERRKDNPNFPGIVPVEQSVRQQFELLERLTPADTGAYLHANGDDANTVGY